MMPERKGETGEAGKTGKAGEIGWVMLLKTSSLIDRNFRVYDFTRSAFFVLFKSFHNYTVIGFTFIPSFVDVFYFYIL